MLFAIIIKSIFWSYTTDKVLGPDKPYLKVTTLPEGKKWAYGY